MAKRKGAKLTRIMKGSIEKEAQRGRSVGEGEKREGHCVGRLLYGGRTLAAKKSEY